MENALRPAADASYAAQLGRPLLDAAEQSVVSAMIGRPMRGRAAAAVRCAWGLPAVLRVAPRLGDGTPFPTTFWLSCPLATKHVGRLEARGAMAELNRRLGDEPAFAEAYAAAHERYVAFRDRLGGPLPRDDSAGGMPTRVKCLHALYGHHLATRDNPVGAEVADRLEPLACPSPCVVADDRGEPQRAGPGRGTR